jgi:hypothetical protein
MGWALVATMRHLVWLGYLRKKISTDMNCEDVLPITAV